MWTTIERAGHLIHVFDPVESPRYGLLFLHDDDEEPTEYLTPDFLNSQRITCLSPIAPQTWWSSRISPTFDASQSAESWLLGSVLPIFADRWRLQTNSIALAGFGTGGQGALRLGFKYPDQFPIVAAIDAAIDHYELYGNGSALDEMYPSREHCRQDSATLHIHPVKQPRHLWFACDPASRWFRGNDRLHEKLGALGVGHEFVESTAERLEAFDKMLKQLIQAWAQEARRLA